MGLLIFFPLFLVVFVVCVVALIYYLPPNGAKTVAEELQGRIRTRTNFQIVYFIMAMISWHTLLTGGALPIISVLTIIGCSFMFVRSSIIKRGLHQQYEEPPEEHGACIVTGADGENPDDCTTHEHEA